MRRFLAFVVGMVLIPAAVLTTGCASTGATQEQSVAGTWSYTVANTPQGVVRGELVLSIADGALAGTFSGATFDRAVPVQDARLVQGRLIFSARPSVDGTLLTTTTSVDVSQNSLEGEIVVPGYGTYPFVATRTGS
jgi:hypothetical protein